MTSDREREQWETDAAAPFLTLERVTGVVEVWALGAQRFTVRAPEHEQVVAGFDAARRVAHELARELE